MHNELYYVQSAYHVQIEACGKIDETEIYAVTWTSNKPVDMVFTYLGIDASTVVVQQKEKRS